MLKYNDQSVIVQRCGECFSNKAAIYTLNLAKATGNSTGIFPRHHSM